MCSQLCMDNISYGLIESDDSSLSDSLEESLSTSLLLRSSSKITTNFLPALYDRLDFRRFLESGLRSSPRRDGWTRERQSMSVTYLHNVILAALQMAGNVI